MRRLGVCNWLQCYLNQFKPSPCLARLLVPTLRRCCLCRELAWGSELGEASPVKSKGAESPRQLGSPCDSQPPSRAAPAPR